MDKVSYLSAASPVDGLEAGVGWEFCVESKHGVCPCGE